MLYLMCNAPYSITRKTKPKHFYLPLSLVSVAFVEDDHYRLFLEDSTRWELWAEPPDVSAVPRPGHQELIPSRFGDLCGNTLTGFYFLVSGNDY